MTLGSGSMTTRHSLEAVAAELGVPTDDVLLVAQIELLVPEEFDDEDETVTDAGRVRILQHFAGGVDPDR